MSKRIFISLPVADVAAATAFYEAVGCTRDTRFSNEAAASMVWSATITFMLAGHDFYRTLTTKPIGDTKTTSAVLIALSFDTREAVDAFADAAIAAGGTEAHGAEDEGFLYSRGVYDLDGHGLGPMWMDENAAAGAAQQADRAAA